jgi:hypothetical protein
MLAFLSLTGCATDRPDAGQYTLNGIEYGVSEGRFRGRWWNYYERGVSYQQGEFHAEAIADFQTALKSRTKDQYWARKYGLHFAPEYFPHRELGISFYHEDRFEDALDELLISLDQNYSSRAAYYVALVAQSTSVTSPFDTQAPTIQIHQPVYELVGGREVTIAGTAADDTFVKSVEINGEPLILKSTGKQFDFEHKIQLQPEDNVVVLTATDLFDQKSEEVLLQLYSDLDGPAIGFGAPNRSQGVVRVTAFDRSGIESVTVNGSLIEMNPLDDETVEFFVDIPQGRNTTTPLIVCTDFAGNETASSLPAPRITNVAMAGDVVFASLNHEAKQIQPRHLAQDPRRLPIISASELTVEFKYIKDGDRFFRDDVMFSFEVSSDEFIESITLNGTPFNVPNDTHHRVISRKIKLEEVGEYAFKVEARDASGTTKDAEITLVRDSTVVDTEVERLYLALPENEWVHRTTVAESILAADTTNEVAQIVKKRFVETLLDTKPRRFNIAVQDPLAIQNMLTARELVNFGGSDDARAAAAVREISTGNVILSGGVRVDSDNVMTIVMSIRDVLTGDGLAAIDVTGDADEIDRPGGAGILSELEFLLEQEFPLVRGEVKNIDGAIAEVDIGISSRIEKGFHCIIYRLKLDQDGFGNITLDTPIIAYGNFHDMKDLDSDVKLILDEVQKAELQDISDLYVLTK